MPARRNYRKTRKVAKSRKARRVTKVRRTRKQAGGGNCAAKCTNGGAHSFYRSGSINPVRYCSVCNCQE